MEAHLFRRYYSRIQTSLRRTIKPALLSLVFLFIVLGNTSSVAADDTYAPYAKLFNNSGTNLTNVHIGQNTSTFTKNGWFINKANKKIVGPRFIFTFEFPDGGSAGAKNAEYSWDHVTGPNTPHTFILRSCDIGADAGGINEASCIYSDIPYKEEAGDLTSFWTDLWQLAFSATGNPTPAMLQSVEDDFNTLTNAVVILRKDNSGQYTKEATQDIIGSDWYTIDSRGTKSTTVDWLTRADQKVSLWYQASQPDNNGGGTPVGPINVDPNNATDDGTDAIKKWFRLYPDSNWKYSHFKIAEVSITKPVSYDQAVADSNDAAINANRSIEKTASSNLPNCHILNGAGPGDGSFVGCIAWLVYYGIYSPIAWFAGILGMLFDFFLGYSLDDTSYRAEFAVNGWKLVRDISNIFFIIILVWTGLSTVFNTGTNMKKVVPQLILNALLINFSLFGTRVIIDISNVVARVFYKSIRVCEGECEKNADGSIKNIKIGVSKYTPLSEKIVSSFDPQKLFSPDVLNERNAVTSNAARGASGNVTIGDDSSLLDRNDYATYYIIVSLIGAAILFAVAMMFWKTAFFFLGRIIGLYVAMIFAPFAVLTRGDMPLLNNVKDLSWNSWLKDLTNYAMLAPIFVFFLYIIYSFLDSGFLKISLGDMASPNMFVTILSITIPMLIVYFMIGKGVGIAKTYAGKIGEMVQDGAMKVIGAGAGLAVGGAAFAGRNIIGRGLGQFGKKVVGTTADGKEITRAAKWASDANNGIFSRLRNNAFSATQTGSWDARNAAVKIGGKEYAAGDTIFKGLGLTDAISSAVGIGKEKALGKDGKPGGNVMINKKRDEARQKELENRMQMSHLSDDDAKAAGEAYKEKLIKEAERNWEAHVGDIKALDAEKKKVAAAEEKLKAETAASTDTAADRLKVSQAQRDLEKAKTDFDTAKNVIIQDIKAGKLTDEKKESETLAAKDTVTRLNKYGKIKDNKTFTNMMRAEYVENLQKSSFWTDLRMESGIKGILGTMIPILGPAIGTMLGGVFAKELADDFVDAATGSRSRAIKAIIKKAASATDKGNALVVLDERLQKYKKDALEAVNGALKDELAKPYESYEKIESDTLRRGVLTKIAELEQLIDDKREIFAKGSTATDKEKAKARYEVADAQDKRDNLKNIEDKISRAQKDLDEKKDREKDAEEKKKQPTPPKTP